MMTEIVDIHFDTRLKHDIKHADVSYCLDRITAVYQMQRMRTDNHSHYNKSHNTRDTNLAANHRH